MVKEKNKIKVVKNLDKKNKGIKFFIQETKAELRKVSWPTKPKVASASLLILVIVISLTAYVTVADIGLSKLFAMLKAIK